MNINLQNELDRMTEEVIYSQNATNLVEERLKASEEDKLLAQQNQQEAINKLLKQIESMKEEKNESIKLLQSELDSERKSKQHLLDEYEVKNINLKVRKSS